MITLIINAPFITPFQCLTDCPDIAQALTLKYGCYTSHYILSENNTITIKRTPPISKGSSDIATHSYSISYRNFHATTSSPLQLVADIIFQFHNFAPTICPLHGAAIEYQKQAYLFLASTARGKSTLASYLTSCGFGYITDDCILLDRENLTVHPFTTPLHLRDGGIDVLKKYGISLDSIRIIDTPSFKRYVYTPHNCILEPLPIGKVFFLIRNTKINTIKGMNTTERMTALLRSSLVEHPLSFDYLQFIANLSHFPCCRLFYSDMCYIKEIIQNE